MIVLIFILSLMIHNGFGCELTVLWQSNPCASDLQAMPNSTHLPLSNEGCEFGAFSRITLINEDRSRIENVNQVGTLQEMLDCDATHKLNTERLIVDETFIIKIVSTNNFDFTLGDEVFLISTSNGTEESADNDKIGPRNCLAMRFRVVPPSSNCNCAPFQLENFIPNCENGDLQVNTSTNATTPTSTTGNNLLPTSTTGNNLLPTSTKMIYSLPNFTNSIFVPINCGTECILIILVSLLLFFIGSVCCIFVLVMAILCLTRKLNRKRFNKRFKKQIKDPEKDPTIYKEKDPKYFIKKIDRTVEAKSIATDHNQVRLVSTNIEADIVIQLPACSNPPILDKILSEKENSDKFDNKSPPLSQRLDKFLSEKENSPKIAKKSPSPML